MHDEKILTDIKFNRDKYTYCNAICTNCGQEIIIEKSTKPTTFTPVYTVGYDFLYEQIKNQNPKISETELNRVVKKKIEELNFNFEETVNIKLVNPRYICPHCKQKLKFPFELVYALIMDGINRDMFTRKGDGYNLHLGANHLRLVLEWVEQGMYEAVFETPIEYYIKLYGVRRYVQDV